jgi:hypothetical protein
MLGKTIKICLMMMVIIVSGSVSLAVQRELGPEELEAKERLRHTVLLPFKFVSDYGAPNGELTMLQIRPTYTISTKNYNFINRPIIPYLDLNGEVGGRPDLPNTGSGDARGLGDISYTVAVEARKLKPVSVAAGIAASLPTAAEDALGSGKWSAGPAVIVLGKHEPWAFLISARQIWSFAGDADRGDVNNFALEPIITYGLTKAWYLFTDPVIVANWEADSGERWMVPLGGGAGRFFNLGGTIMDLKVEGYFNAIKPDGAPDWTLGFTVGFVFNYPK